MVFAHDTEVGLGSAVALVNTSGAAGDTLAEVSALDDFIREWGWTGRRRGTRSELAQVQALRPRLRRFWTGDEHAVVEEVNALLREAGALPQLVRHEKWDYHLHATSDDAPLADRMAVEAAMAMLDVVRQKELARLHVCAAIDCGDVLVDLTKNRSRRFCSLTCSNRTNVAAFRARNPRPV